MDTDSYLSDLGGLEERVHRSIHFRGNDSPLRRSWQEDAHPPFSPTADDHCMGCPLHSLGVPCPRQLASGSHKLAGSRNAPCTDDAPLGRQNGGDRAGLYQPAKDSQPDVQDAEREDRGIHVRCHDSHGPGLNISNTAASCGVEGGRIEDLTACKSRCTTLSLPASLGKLRRIGSLGLDGWATQISSTTTPCRYVQPHYFDHETGSDGAMYSVQRSPPLEEPGGSRNDNTLLVDTLSSDLDRYRVADYVGQALYPGGGVPETLVDEMKVVRDYGFDHIIVIGEFLYGMLFLDCYGRVFAWDEMTWVMWPCGNSLEEARAIGIQYNRTAWTLKDGKVHESEYNEAPPSPIIPKKKKKNRRKNNSESTATDNNRTVC